MNFVDRTLIKMNLKLNPHFLFLAWNENPTITISETMTYPIENVKFPTVTLCSRNSNPDRWGPTIKVFDYVKRRCPTGRYRIVATSNLAHCSKLKLNGKKLSRFQFQFPGLLGTSNKKTRNDIFFSIIGHQR